MVNTIIAIQRIIMNIKHINNAIVAIDSIKNVHIFDNI